ncbi:MAG: radical SAM protein [Pseudomonadota bacterium]|nr:radical SAM protein [Pseudomonadota bacterium]
MHNDILSRSPLDSDAVTIMIGAKAGDVKAATARRWKPSRFNVQATTTEGWLLLWNTYSGSMNAFRPQQRGAVQDLIDQRGLIAPEDGIAGYLVQRGYIIPGDADELRRVQYAFGQENHRTDRLELILLASEDCNFRCTYCYEDFRRGTMRPEVRAGIKKLVEARAGLLRDMSVGWFGGEPLYGMAAIEDLAPFFVGVAEREGIEYYSHITTNAYLLTRDVVDRLLAWRITDYQITLDGLQDDHDKLRPARDGRSTFQTIYDNLAAMSERTDDFSVVIRVNFTPANVPGLEQFLELLQARFRDDDRFTISFHAVGRWGGDNDTNVDICGRDESHDVRMKLKSVARSLGLRVTSGWKPGAGVGTDVCYAARPYNFIVGAHGDLMKCTIDLDKKDRNLVGKLLPDGTLDLDVDKMALWTAPAFERDTGCQSCHMLPSCQGLHCPQIRMDHNIAPCPSIRRTAKQEMIDYFEAKQASAADVAVPAAAALADAADAGQSSTH